MLLGFKVFIDKVEAGTKRQTIRAMRKKRPFRLGDDLQFYSGLRTKKCYKIREDDVCKELFNILIDCNGGPISPIRVFKIKADSLQALVYNCMSDPANKLTNEELEDLAIRDGFPGTAAMLKWFLDTHGSHSKEHHGALHQVFQIIRW
jgi:hypothetical protein